jgi:hypothetical protein
MAHMARCGQAGLRKGAQLEQQMILVVVPVGLCLSHILDLQSVKCGRYPGKLKSGKRERESSQSITALPFRLHMFGLPIDFTLASPHLLIISSSHETRNLELQVQNC